MRPTVRAPLSVTLALAALAAAGACTSRSPAAHTADAPVVSLAEEPALRLRAPRIADTTTTVAAGQARAAFWSAFRAERYDALPGVLRQLSAAVLEHPRDAETVLLLAHAHLWKVAERNRLDERDPTVTDHLVLAEHYFEEAYRLAPDDHRILGWLGSARAPLGAVRQDTAISADAARVLREAVRRYPQFNHFTAAFTQVGLPASDPRFQEALAMMWRNVDACSGASPGDAATDGRVYELARRADSSCANTAKAPHNFEGFVLTLGDMVVKTADAERAVVVYERARLSPTYAAWPYRDTLEARIRNAALHAQRARHGQPVPTIAGSGYSCAACHAQR